MNELTLTHSTVSFALTEADEQHRFSGSSRVERATCSINAFPVFVLIQFKAYISVI